MHNTRGYNATWEIRNDSLFLIKISYPLQDTIRAVQRISNAGEGFASWFNGQLQASDGQVISDAEYTYGPIYQFSKMFYLENGHVVKTKTGSNKNKADEINTYLRMNRLAKDTVFSALKKLDWVKLDNEDRLYDQDYWLYYNKYGKIKMVGMLGGMGKTEDRKENHRNSKERKLIKNAVKNVNLDYLRPLTSFKLFIAISYNEETQTLELEKR